MLEVFYVDGQSLGNEQKAISRRARIVVVHQWSSNADESKAFWKDVGDKTNNEAEYLALIEALSLASKKAGSIEIRSDSRLIVNQMEGGYRVKDPELKPLWEKAQNLAVRLGSVRLKWVPRDENLAGLWLDGRWPGGSVQKL